MMLIDEAGASLGKVSRDQALYLSFEKGYDLVLINEHASPPLAKLMDYGKYLYAKQKQVSKQRAQSHGSQLKEIRMGIKIDEHDLEVKTNQAKKFLSRGDKVKVTIQLRGREMAFAHRVPNLVDQIINLTDTQIKKDLSYDSIMVDVLDLVLISIGFLLVAGIVEVYITPLIF